VSDKREAARREATRGEAAQGEARRESDERPLDGGAYIGREPELASETIPGGVRPDDERVSAHETQSSGEGALEERVQGRDDEWPTGHREDRSASDDDVRRAGENA
jgi:hypothetical protein